MKWTTLLEERAETTFRAANGLIQRVEDSKLTWKPPTGSNWLTMGQLLRHMGCACGACCRGFVTGEWQDLSLDPKWNHDEAKTMPPAEAYIAVKSRSEALALLEEDRKLTLAMIAKAGEAEFETKRFVAPWGGAELNLGTHFLTSIQHLDIHKSQLFYYLKLQGKSVNTLDLWGMS